MATDIGPAQRIEVVQGDLLAQDVDAVVNAANERLAPGGGVCGAIHAAAGPELARACARIGRCPTGEAVITPGFALAARFVIHAVGPVWQGGAADEDKDLASAYTAALDRAREQGLHSIAFPAISTGIYGFPRERGAGIAVAACREFVARSALPDRILLVAFDAATAALYRRALEGSSA